MATQKIMISFQFTGIRPEARAEVLNPVIKRLKRDNIEYFYSGEELDIFKNMSPDMIYDLCLEEQKTCTQILFVFLSKRQSRGMLLELTQAKQSKQPAEVFIALGCSIQEWMIPFLDYEKKSPAKKLFA